MDIKDLKPCDTVVFRSGEKGEIITFMEELFIKSEYLEIIPIEWYYNLEILEEYEIMEVYRPQTTEEIGRIQEQEKIYTRK